LGWGGASECWSLEAVHRQRSSISQRILQRRGHGGPLYRPGGARKDMACPIGYSSVKTKGVRTGREAWHGLLLRSKQIPSFPCTGKWEPTTAPPPSPSSLPFTLFVPIPSISGRDSLHARRACLLAAPLLLGAQDGNASATHVHDHHVVGESRATEQAEEDGERKIPTRALCRLQTPTSSPSAAAGPYSHAQAQHTPPTRAHTHGVGWGGVGGAWPWRWRPPPLL
jgi:hypothetical protein